MVWFILGHLVTTLLDWMSIGRLSSGEKDVEILLLRQQLMILQRRLDKPICPERVEKLMLAALAAKLKTAQPSAELATPDATLPGPHSGVRFLHGGDLLVADSIGVVLHGVAHTAGLSGRLHSPSRWAVGHSAGTTDDLAARRTAACCSFPHSRP